MNAIALLKSQHRTVEALFKRFEQAQGKVSKQKIFTKIADALAIHATIEERHFYPVVREAGIEDPVEEAYDEHLGVKKLIVDAMNGTERPGFDGLVAALKGAVEHHVDEEEHEMFPRVQKKIEASILKSVGETMEADAAELESEGEARQRVRVEIEPPVVQH